MTDHLVTANILAGCETCGKDTEPCHVIGLKLYCPACCPTCHHVWEKPMDTGIRPAVQAVLF